MTGFSGSCLCGAIAYEVTGEPVNMWNCHCDHCRKVTGAAYATNVFVKAEDMTITQGTPATYQNQADSGNTMTRYFCRDCGSPMFNESTGRAGIRVIRVGSIDGSGFVKPWADLFAPRALAFTTDEDDREKFERMPPPGAFGPRD